MARTSPRKSSRTRKSNALPANPPCNKTPEKQIGNKIEVWHCVAHHTKGGVTRSMLWQNKAGRILSRAKTLNGRRQHAANPHILNDNRAAPFQ